MNNVDCPAGIHDKSYFNTCVECGKKFEDGDKFLAYGTGYVYMYKKEPVIHGAYMWICCENGNLTSTISIYCDLESIIDNTDDVYLITSDKGKITCTECLKDLRL